MSAIDTLTNICSTNLASANLRCCLVSSDKRPYKVNNEMAKPNSLSDFVSLTDLLENDQLERYAGIGISIQASNITAIDVDHCFSNAFDLSSADDRANQILEMFADYAYCEFSFSGKGLRILFNMPLIEDYSSKYYIKNERYGIEFYQPSKSFRYVTITGRPISDLEICQSDEINDIVMKFLDTYMRRQISRSYDVKTSNVETRTFEELMKIVKVMIFKNHQFQDAWFAVAPGSGKDESERDYRLIATLYENVTQDKDLLKRIFEQSPYFKSKDSKHIFKWTYQEGRYYNYVYDMIRSTK